MATRLMTTAAVLIALAVPAMADQCGKAVTQQDMNECARRVQRVEEAKLSRTYEKMMRTENEALRITLRASQSAWVQYRERQCDLESYGSSGGSVHPTVVAYCFAHKARACNAELDSLAHCEEGDMGCTRF